MAQRKLVILVVAFNGDCGPELLHGFRALSLFKKMLTGCIETRGFDAALRLLGFRQKGIDRE